MSAVDGSEADHVLVIAIGLTPYCCSTALVAAIGSLMVPISRTPPRRLPGRAPQRTIPVRSSRTATARRGSRTARYRRCVRPSGHRKLVLVGHRVIRQVAII